MTYPLLSPGTSVTTTDESNYASAGQGTVPLIIFGTHEFKARPSGSGIAEGTLPENANKLYPITSQRELLQTFGNPIFYTKNGSSVHGYELNEYGLHAAYQYLGIANRAYVIRAAIDFAQLSPSTTEPRSEADHGTFWFDTQSNSWGIYEWNGQQWIEKDLFVLEDESDLDLGTQAPVAGQHPPLTSIGASGDLAMVVAYDKKVLYQKVSTSWHLVGSQSWETVKSDGSTQPKFKYGETRPSNGVVGDILFLHTPKNIMNAAAIYNTGHWLLKTFNVNTGAWDQTAVPIYPSFFEPVIQQRVGAVYLQMDADTDNRSTGTHNPRFGFTEAGTAVFEFKTFNGLQWVTLKAKAGATQPSGQPAEGTLWYDPSLIVNIKVNDGFEWVSYLEAYPLTDPNGVILSASRPLLQSTGGPLVNNDLWIDTSDLENFPKMYRRQGSQWVAIDVANNVDPVTGIAFGDASSTLSYHFSEGMKLFDLSQSTNTVKVYKGGRWVTDSGYQTNGVPFFGRKAQRQMIVRSLMETITNSEAAPDIRAETVYFNLIAAPGYIELIDEMVTLNTDMKEVAFIIGDTPARLKPDATSIQTFANAELSGTVGNSERGIVTFNANVGVYYPWGLSTNVDGNEVMVPPSTLALRTIAYSDSISYPWLAPAGFTRGLVTNAGSVGYLTEQGEFKAALLNEGQRDTLYINNINPIAYIPNKGLVLYGQKTRHNLATARDRINVARLTNYLRYNLDALSKAFLFQPNDFHTRDEIRTVFERFLADLVSLRGLYDFAVVCDETNNTPERVDRHELWVDVAIKPVQAVEFIYIPMRLVSSGADLNGNF